jgi:hypothetical protein
MTGAPKRSGSQKLRRAAQISKGALPVAPAQEADVVTGEAAAPTLVTDLTSEGVALRITHYRNADSDVIYVLADRLKILATDFAERVRAQRSWVTPFFLIVSLFAVQSTSTFRKTLGVSSDTLKVLYWVVIVGLVLWLMLSFANTARRRNAGVDAFVERCMHSDWRRPQE